MIGRLLAIVAIVRGVKCVTPVIRKHEGRRDDSEESGFLIETGKFHNRPGLYPTRRRVPENLVLLKLKPNGKTRSAGEPCCQLRGINLGKCRAHKHRANLAQSVRAKDVGRPVEIRSIANHELDLVDRLQAAKVGPDVRLNFARAGCLDVEDDAHAGVDSAGVDRSAGLEQDGLTGVGKTRHERIHLRLQQRLAASDFDQLIAKFQRKGDDPFEIDDFSLRERMRRIAVDTPQVARREANEDARQPGKCAFTLQAAVNLVDKQRSDRLAIERLQAVWVRDFRGPWSGSPAAPTISGEIATRSSIPSRITALGIIFPWLKATWYEDLESS